MGCQVTAVHMLLLAATGLVKVSAALPMCWVCWQLWPGPAEDAEDLLSVCRSDLAIDLRLLLLPQLLLHLGQHLLHPLDLWSKAKSNDERAVQAQAYLCYDQHLLHLLDLWCKAISNDEMAAGVFMLSSTTAASIGSVKQSHEQWYIYQHLLHQLDPQRKANATAR